MLIVIVVGAWGVVMDLYSLPCAGIHFPASPLRLIKKSFAARKATRKISLRHGILYYVEYTVFPVLVLVLSPSRVIHGSPSLHYVWFDCAVVIPY